VLESSRSGRAPHHVSRRGRVRNWRRRCDLDQRHDDQDHRDGHSLPLPRWPLTLSRFTGHIIAGCYCDGPAATGGVVRINGASVTNLVDDTVCMPYAVAIHPLTGALYAACQSDLISIVGTTVQQVAQTCSGGRGLSFTPFNGVLLATCPNVGIVSINTTGATPIVTLLATTAPSALACLKSRPTQPPAASMRHVKAAASSRCWNARPGNIARRVDRRSVRPVPPVPFRIERCSPHA
jgi:hypothetical protein